MGGTLDCSLGALDWGTGRESADCTLGALDWGTGWDSADCTLGAIDWGTGWESVHTGQASMQVEGQRAEMTHCCPGVLVSLHPCCHSRALYRVIILFRKSPLCISIQARLHMGPGTNRMFKTSLACQYSVKVAARSKKISRL